MFAVPSTTMKMVELAVGVMTVTLVGFSVRVSPMTMGSNVRFQVPGCSMLLQRQIGAQHTYTHIYTHTHTYTHLIRHTGGAYCTRQKSSIPRHPPRAANTHRAIDRRRCDAWYASRHSSRLCVGLRRQRHRYRRSRCGAGRWRCSGERRRCCGLWRHAYVAHDIDR